MDGPPPEVRVLGGAEALAGAVGDQWAAAAAEAISARGRFAVALAGGSTPRRAYELLAAREGLPWERTAIFFGDERCVPPDDPRSNFAMAREALLGRVPLRREAIHRIEGERPPEEAAARYEVTLRRELGVPPRLDLVLLGMGSEGHTASLFPGSEALEERSRFAVAPATPQAGVRRVTLTLPALDAARQVVFLVAGEEKRAALAEVLAGARGEGPLLPAARVRPGKAIFLVTADALPATPQP